jgi:hypothetical protein
MILAPPQKREYFRFMFRRREAVDRTIGSWPEWQNGNSSEAEVEEKE